MMNCPQCAKPMQVFTVDGLELDRCRGCGRVWLDLNEVERLFGGLQASLSEDEVDQPCPRGHGPMVSGTLGDQPAIVCSHCRGAWVIDTVSPAETRPAAAPKPAPAKPMAKARAKPREITVSCDVCSRRVPLSQVENTSRGTVCRSCELAAPSGPVKLSGPDLAEKIYAVLQFLADD